MSQKTNASLLAGKRARDRVAEKLRDVTGYYAVAEVRITPAQYGDGTVWCALALTSGRREIPLPGQARKDVVHLIRGAFPQADWEVAQDYDVITGTLREHLVRLPASLRGDAL